MPNGFFGRPATAYLGAVSNANTEAAAASAQAAADTPAGINTRMREHRLPFSREEAAPGAIGRFTTGRGDSSNIVAGQNEYEKISYAIDRADEKMGECLYNVAKEIEVMCQTSFIMPDVVPRCLNISGSVKNALNEYRELTEEALIQTRKYAREITDIG